jgi:anaerobic magnesium-protoporphyrin IX monomethyl ester cyclase
MKVCLVNPPHPYLKQPTAQAPLGLLYVAASLRTRGVDIVVLDLSDRYWEDEIEYPQADLYGITGTVLDRKPCIETAKRIKQKYTQAKVIVGGPISLTPDQITDPAIDSLVIGEGEYVIHKVIEDFPHVQATYKADRITDLDALPFPARDMILHKGGNVFAYNKNYKEGGSTVIITSRGCPYSCSFCASPGIWERKVTIRSIDNVLCEIDEIVNKHKIYQLRFSDDTLTLDTKRLRQLCTGVKKYGIVWRASIRTKPNSVEMFKQMYEAGCREVSFGVESADPNVLRVLQKGNTVEDNYNGIVNAKKAGMVVRILFMIGTPGESISTVDQNIDFLKSINNYYDTIALTNFIPIPGSAIAKRPVDFDCTITDTNIDNYNFYMWTPSGLNEWTSFIALRNLDKKEFERNKRRMQQHIVESGKSNHG